MKYAVLLSMMAASLPALGATAPAEPPPMTQAQIDHALDVATERCRDHLDLRAYYDVAMDRETERVTPAVIESLRTFGETGHVALPAASAGDPEAARCAAFAEGLLHGAVGHALVRGFIEAIATAMTAVFEGLGQAFRNSPESAPAPHP